MDIVAHIEKNMTDADWAELEEQRASEDAAMERDLIEAERQARIDDAKTTALALIGASEGNPYAQLHAGMTFALAIINGGRRA